MAIETTTAKSEVAQTSGQFSTFFVEDLFFGVDVLHVQEVLRPQQMTSVPQAPHVIEGLINLLGQIVTAIDMRRRLRLPQLAGDQAPMNIVVRTMDGAVSLLVDEIGDVLDMDSATYERPPQNLDIAARELIRGVYKLEDRLLLILDTEKAVDVESSLSCRNERLDLAYQEETLGDEGPVSSILGAGTQDSTKPALSQSPTKSRSKKRAAK